MSSKQEPAQAPVTVSQAEPAQPPPPAPQPQMHQPPPQYQVPTTAQQFQGPVVYQNYGPGGPAQGPVHFHQGPPVWNQPPPPTIHYVQYQPPPDKIHHSYNHFGTVHFAQPMENGEVLIRGPLPQHFMPHHYLTMPPQWYPPGHQGPPQPGQFVPTYATNFNVANDPAYNPNHPMNRGRRDDFQGAPDNPMGYMQFVPFVAPIGMMESQAHASASYTANWVSSTSSIPPEMKDEPESDNISQYDAQRPTSQLNGDNWSERDEHFSPSTAHQHSNPNPPPPQPIRSQAPVEKPAYNESRKSKPMKNSKSDRTDDKRELTFDERLEKARMQKDRVENEGDESPNTNSAAQGSVTSGAAPVTNPRSNGQRKEYNRQEGNMNNQNNGRARNNQNGEKSGGEQQQQRPYQPRQQYERNNGNGNNGEKQPRRDNFRYENNQQTAAYNQNQNFNQQYQPQPPQHQNQGYNQNQNQTGPAPEPYRNPNYRGKNPRGRGGYNNTQYPRPPYRQQNPSGPAPPAPGSAPFIPSPIVDPQMYATINAFQNHHINNGPPGGPRMPLLPGPFGLQRPQFQQEEKFRNTWLDANSYPIPMNAMINFDRLRELQNQNGVPVNNNYRGPPRGRGGYSYRGGYRGGNNNGIPRAQNAQNAQNENGARVVVVEKKANEEEPPKVEDEKNKVLEAVEKSEKSQPEEPVKTAEQVVEPTPTPEAPPKAAATESSTETSEAAQ